ncbi:MAG: hypothetical protein SOH99_10995 [Acidipropionibacterium acidipropionici]|jgi:hypothetical protein|uniref:hypothetical protein n=1 Tax=Acidipropionibacterium acidipropionici TaxID=1748 RepID=UPI00055C2B73|nr:hypothetical protein [Acidipropionibacterium acidipropionici]ALN14853.1 hypothetical protein ASQ49_05670 [Acidipropionibacterium acidipropionici]APZ09394.1 hypothetical protein BWX38_09255 [Acidipropionibacterium acidipropionici]QCV96606.1 hypothetical protein FEZ30_16340 [Acidipropionibacterium acidipropionici]
MDDTAIAEDGAAHLERGSDGRLVSRGGTPVTDEDVVALIEADRLGPLDTAVMPDWGRELPLRL